MIDLRSDTVTRPTEGMRRAMLEATVGDDVFGEDPTVNRLEEYVADLLGKEAALYAPSGTMTNQVGVQVNTDRGEEVLLHEGSHIFVYEAGAPAMLSGVQLRTLPGEDGVIAPETVRAAVATTAKELGLKVHLDGARLFNAQAATGVPASEWCAHADTVSVCSSKGLGAPVGSLLAGDEETIGEARRVRKAFGGGMRQAGIIAAAALYAFENHVDRLGEGHEHAPNPASGLREAGYEAKEPETNLVLVAVDNPPEFLQALAREGVLATPGKPGYVRLCTHLDVGERQIEAAIQAAARITSSAIQR